MVLGGLAKVQPASHSAVPIVLVPTIEADQPAALRELFAEGGGSVVIMRCLCPRP